MTLTSEEIGQVIAVASRLDRETLTRNIEGTLPVPVTRTATLGAFIAAGATGLVKVDGDLDPIYAVNATGVPLGTNSRALVSFFPPHGVFITSPLKGIADWTDYAVTLSTAGGSPTSQPTINSGTLQGRYRREGMTCDLAIWLLNDGTINGGNGDWRFSIPFKADNSRGEQWTGTVKVYTAVTAQQWLGNCYFGYGGDYTVVAPEVPLNSTTSVIATFRNSSTGASGQGIPNTGANFPFNNNGANMALACRYVIAPGF